MATSQGEGADRRHQILEAAVRVFSRKGFQGATNKDIAREAGGISPGLIYHYYKDKEDLLLSIFRDRAPMLQLAEHPESFMELPPRVALTMIGRAYLETVLAPRNLALFRIMISEASRHPQISEALYRILLGRIFGVFMAYFQRQIELGRLRPCDPAIAVRSFIGMFVGHIMMRELFRQPEALAVSDEQVVTQAVDTFLSGLEQR